MILSHLILGFITSYIGYLSPSMLTITASKISVQQNKKIARQFVLGASIVVLLQVFLAIWLVYLLTDYPFLINYVKKISIIIFVILSIVFIKKSFKKSEVKKHKIIKNGFWLGMSLSLINMFAIPFFAVAHSSLVNHNWVSTSTTCTSYFGIGTVLGTFVILSSYVYFAKRLAPKISMYMHYFNLAIGIITGLVALFSIVKLYF